jgi:hypothetical protein
MNDEPPIILVDNLRLLPVQGISNRDAGPDAGAAHENPPFGIVDRVTISHAARRAYRQSQYETAGYPHPAKLPFEARKAITYNASAKQLIEKF